MMMSLNTPEKAIKIVEWARPKTVNDKMQMTPEAIMSAATRIGRGMNLWIS